MAGSAGRKESYFGGNNYDIQVDHSTQATQGALAICLPVPSFAPLAVFCSNCLPAMFETLEENEQKEAKTAPGVDETVFGNE